MDSKKWLFGFLVFCVVFTLPVFLIAGEYRLRPLFVDVISGDGINDAGSRSNPYILEDSHGREINRIWFPYRGRNCSWQSASQPPDLLWEGSKNK